MTDLGRTLRVHRPAPNIRAFYDGRQPGPRMHGPQWNWLDDAAFALGTASYAIVSDGEALVYDTHSSVPHARLIRAALEREGCEIKAVVLSHWHVDHVAGNEAFADLPIIANARTAAALVAHRAGLEAGDPPIRPLVMPTEIFTEDYEISVGATRVLLRQVDIHSHDGTLLLLPDSGHLLAGDALEDPVTYVAEPDRLQHHLTDLARLETWSFERILPNHGAEAVIAAGGFDRRLIAATRTYIERLLRCPADPALAALDLAAFAAPDFAAGAIAWLPAYDAVHRQNVARVLAAANA